MGQDWGAASSPLFPVTFTGYGDYAGLDWLARAKGSLGWNDETAASGL